MNLIDKIVFENDVTVYRVYFRETFSKKHTVFITDKNFGNQLYRSDIDKFSRTDLNNNLYFYYVFNKSTEGINVNITCENETVFKTTININYEYLTTPIVLSERPVGWGGMGDNLLCLPAIKKLSKSINRKIDVITHHPQIFINNPYVGNVFKIQNNESNDDLYEKYSLMYRSCFYDLMPRFPKKSRSRYIENMFAIDLRQTVAYDCDFNLLPEEYNLEFYPDPYVPIDLPENYIVINPYISGIDRDFGKEGWQKIIDNLNDYNINVVTIGLTGKNYDLNVRLGKNLCGLDCQSNLSQTWHIINNSKGILTFDCGIYILAGTTNAQIFLIDTYIHPYWHTPFRNGSYNYKHTVIKGTCSEYCLSNLKYYSMQENILIQPLVQKCALNYSEFKCIPSVETVSNTVIKHFK